MDGMKSAAISASIVGNLAGSVGPGVIASAAGAPSDTVESALQVGTQVQDAFDAGLKGAQEADDAANAEPVAEPESAEHRDAEDDSTFAEGAVGGDDYSDEGDLSRSADADADLSDWGVSAGDFGGWS